MKADDPVGKIQTLLCASCGCSTEHTVLYSYKTHWRNDDDDGIFGGATHDFLCCNGCKDGTYRRTTWSTEDDQAVSLFPLRSENFRRTKDFRHTPWDGLLDNAYKETIAAFNGGLLTLAGAGVRLMIEGICKAEGVKDGPVFDKTTGAPIIERKTGLPAIRDNLEGRINGMAQRDLVSKKQAHHLHEIRFLGNDSAHELYLPDSKIVSFALDIVEQLIDQVYEQPHKAKILSERERPKR